MRPVRDAERFFVATHDGRPAATTTHRRNGHVVAVLSRDEIKNDAPNTEDVLDLIDRVRFQLGDCATYCFALMTAALTGEPSVRRLYLMGAVANLVARHPSGITFDQLLRAIGGRVNREDLHKTLADLLDGKLVEEVKKGRKNLYRLESNVRA